MNFDNIFDRLKNRVWSPMSDMDAVDMIIKSYIEGDICANYCRYRETADEDCLCDVIRDCGKCPPDRLN